jgi:hypothetical protein
MADDNSKLPIDPWSDGTITPKYGWVYGSADALGGHKFTYRNINEPDKNSSQELTPSGSYKTIHQDADKKEVVTKLHPGETRDYVAGGRSEHTDGHKDMSIESTFREVITGDHNFQGGRNGFVGYAENLIRGAKNDFKAVMGSSESKSFATSQGDVVEEHAGHYHISYEKDYIAAVKSNMVTMVNEGDYALSVQAGNYDVQILKKARIYASQDILIRSATNITLQAPGGVTILDGSLSVAGSISSGVGATGTFTSATGQTIHVQSGLVTNIF